MFKSLLPVICMAALAAWPTAHAESAGDVTPLQKLLKLPLREHCEGMLFYAEARSRLTLARPGEADIAAYARAAMRYVRAHPDSEYQGFRSALVSHFTPYALGLIEARLRALGLFVAKRDHPERGRYFVLNRRAVLALDPTVEPFLPRGYELILSPEENLHHGVMGFVDGTKHAVALPISILEGKFDYDSKQTLAHEALHMAFRHEREQKKHRRLNHWYYLWEDLGAEAARLVGGAYVHSSPEEVFTFYMNALNAFDEECRTGLRPYSTVERNLRRALERVRNFMELYGQHVFPAFLSGMPDGDFHQGEDGLIFTTPVAGGSILLGQDYPRRLRGAPLAWMKAELEKDIQGDLNLIERLKPYFETFSAHALAEGGKLDCGRTDEFWQAMRVAGVDPARFRLRR